MVLVLLLPRACWYNSTRTWAKKRLNRRRTPFLPKRKAFKFLFLISPDLLIFRLVIVVYLLFVFFLRNEAKDFFIQRIGVSEYDKCAESSSKELATWKSFPWCKRWSVAPEVCVYIQRMEGREWIQCVYEAGADCRFRRAQDSHSWMHDELNLTFPSWSQEPSLFLSLFALFWIDCLIVVHRSFWLRG